MAYSITNLRTPGGRLRRPASTVFNPLSSQRVAPPPTPDYNQQIAGFMGSQDMAVPQFNAADQSASSSAPWSFAGLPAAASLAAPNMGPASVTGPNGPVSVDWANDPMYQQAQAYYQQIVDQARAQALGAERQSLIRYGSGDLLRQVLGGGASEDDINAANNNTYGTTQELGRWNTRALSGIDSATNRNNLYFSSTRARDRGLQQEDFGRQQTRTANQLQDMLTGIAQGLLGAQQQAQAGMLGAAQTAYGNALQQAMAQAYYGGGPTATATSGLASSYGGSPGGVPPYVSGPTPIGGEVSSYGPSGNPYAWQPPSPYLQSAKKWWATV